MEPTTIPEPAGWSELSKTEQILYLEALWDRVAEQPPDLPVPESHLELVEARLADYRRDPGRSQPARDVIERLTKSRR